jgi:hypothetical protein
MLFSEPSPALDAPVSKSATEPTASRSPPVRGKRPSRRSIWEPREMAMSAELEIGDAVELTVVVDAAPAGAVGSLSDLLGDGIAIVEVWSPSLAPSLDRRVFAAVEEHRPVASEADARAPAVAA